MYFNWSAYPFEMPPEMRGQRGCHPVVVIGAGPVGLSLALGLARSGIEVVVLERGDQVSDGSRAISMDAMSMNFVDQLGLGDAVAAYSISCDANLVYCGDMLVMRQDYGRARGEKHSPYTVLQQCWLEQFLLDALCALPEAEVRWQSEVVDLSQDDGGVQIIVSTPAGQYKMESRYAVACDGARGTCRRLAGRRYEPLGMQDVSQRAFIVCDFQMKTDLSHARRLYLHPPYQPDAMMLLHPQPFDTWRLDYPLADDESPQMAIAPEQIEARLTSHLNWMGEHGPREVIWSSLYRPRAATLQSYRHGRLMFAGDAAHLLPIFGGRGLNLGLGDSRNLCWRLTALLRGGASDSILNDYDRERQSILRKAVSDLSEASLFMARPTRASRLMSRAVQELAGHRPFAAALLDPYRAPRRSGYSPTDDWQDDPAPGAVVGNPLPNPQLSGGRWLHDLLGPTITLVTWNLSLSDEGWSAQLPADLTWLPLQPEDDPDGQTADLLQAEVGLILLVRPDRYIAARTISDAPNLGSGLPHCLVGALAQMAILAHAGDTA